MREVSLDRIGETPHLDGESWAPGHSLQRAHPPLVAVACGVPANRYHASQCENVWMTAIFQPASVPTQENERSFYVPTVAEIITGLTSPRCAVGAADGGPHFRPG